MRKNLTVALVQARPIFNNLPQSVEKAVALIEQAARQNAELIVFGESWLAGYPAWLDHCPNAALWDYEPTKAVYAEMRRNSVVVAGKEVAQLAEAARANRVTIVIGANERIETGAGNGTLYNALLTFDETSTLR